MVETASHELNFHKIGKRNWLETQLAAPPPFQQCPSLSDGISNVPELCLHLEEESSEGYLWERKAAGWQWKFVFGHISRESNTEGRNRRQLGLIDNYSEVQKWGNENTTRSRQNSVAGRHQGSRLWSCKPCPLQLDYCDGNNLYKGWNDHRRNDGYHVRDKSERLKQTEHQQHTTLSRYYVVNVYEFTSITLLNQED